MSESIVDSKHIFSPFASSGNSSLGLENFDFHRQAQGTLVDQGLHASYEHQNLSSLPLDSNSLLKFLAGKKHGSGEFRRGSASENNFDASFLEWSNISSLPNVTAQRGNSKKDSEVACANAANHSARTPVFLPTKVEQLNPNFEANYVSLQVQSQSISNSQQLAEKNKSALATDFDNQLKLRVVERKYSLDATSKNDPIMEPSGEEKMLMTLTERIQVPSSDHVAEIVGKNGQRIKHLREQLKVWVKTPSRDELPIFEITGLPEKLIEAKRIILQMSDHFTKVQQERLSRVEPNRVEDRLYVEQDKVGLIVGASGQTIRWVQQLSDTHIATPRKQESIPGLPPLQTYFTICGTRERVRFAKQLVCEYVKPTLSGSVARFRVRDVT